MTIDGKKNENEMKNKKTSATMTITSGADFGRAIAEVRRTRELSAQDAADRTGISPAYLSQIENGRTTRLLEHHLRILRRLGARVIVEFPDAD